MAQRSIRFGFHDGKNHRASTWKLWTEASRNSNKSDVYLACRSLGGTFKASLHESGKWHIAYSQQAFEDNVKGSIPKFKDRYIEKWDRPSEIEPGITLAFRIVTPWSAITNTKEGGNFREVTWLPKAPKPKATEIDIIITRSTIPVTGWPCKRSMGTSLISSIPLVNGDIVWAVYRLVKMPDLSYINNRSGHFYKGKSIKDLEGKN